MMEEKCGEFVIKYDERVEKFIAYNGTEEVASSLKLADLKKRLDRIGVVRKGFKRFKVLSVTSGNHWSDIKKEPRIVEYEVTSVVDGSRCWLTEVGTKQRRQENITHYYAETEANRKILARVVELYKERRKLDGRIEAEKSKATTASIPKGASTEQD